MNPIILIILPVNVSYNITEYKRDWALGLNTAFFTFYREIKSVVLKHIVSNNLTSESYVFFSFLEKK